MFAHSLVLAGAAVIVLAVMPRLAGAITLIGTDDADELRGRMFAFVQTGARAVLVLAVSVVNALVGAAPSWRLSIAGHAAPAASSRALLLLAGVAGVAVGIAALRQMDRKTDGSVPCAR